MRTHNFAIETSKISTYDIVCSSYTGHDIIVWARKLAKELEIGGEKHFAG